jgi:hypothetical protein
MLAPSHVIVVLPGRSISQISEELFEQPHLSLLGALFQLCVEPFIARNERAFRVS